MKEVPDNFNLWCSIIASLCFYRYQKGKTQRESLIFFRGANKKGMERLQRTVASQESYRDN